MKVHDRQRNIRQIHVMFDRIRKERSERYDLQIPGSIYSKK